MLLHFNVILKNCSIRGMIEREILRKRKREKERDHSINKKQNEDQNL